MPKYIHVLLDYSKQPAMMVCHHCGAKKALQLPASLDDASKQAKVFVAIHKSCKKGNIIE
jgi:hypothetical protein